MRSLALTVEARPLPRRLGCESLFTGAISFPTAENTGVGLTTLKRKKPFSRLVISPGFLVTEMLPALVGYLVRVKLLNSPKLSLPKVVKAADIANVADMEADGAVPPPAATPNKEGGSSVKLPAALFSLGVALCVGYYVKTVNL